MVCRSDLIAWEAGTFLDNTSLKTIAEYFEHAANKGFESARDLINEDIIDPEVVEDQYFPEEEVIA